MEKVEIKRLPEYAQDVTGLNIIDKRLEWRVPGGEIERLSAGGKIYLYPDGSYGFESKDNWLIRYYPNQKYESYSKINGEYQLTYENLPDGTSRGYHDNGRVSEEWLPDKTMRAYYDSGVLKEEKLPDGTHKNYYKSRKLKSEGLPSGVFRAYYESGQMSYESVRDYTKEKHNKIRTRSWYENGQLELDEDFLKHTYLHLDENGRLIKHTTKGVDDTKEYLKQLAIKKVAERQAEKSEKMRKQAEARGEKPKRVAVKKLNPLQKAVAIRKAKKELSK